MTDIRDLRRILSDYKRVAMVGLSDNWYRPSNFAAKYLLDHGFEVIPVPFRDAYPFGGGLHCATGDVLRRGECEDYFADLVPDTLIRAA